MIREHSFVGGLNTDNTLNAKPEGTLSDAMDISIFTESGNSTLSVQNIKGNIPIEITDAEEGYDRTDYVIVAIEPIRRDFIVFWANVNNNGYGIIDKLVYETETEFTRVELYKSTNESTNLELRPNIKYSVETSYIDSETIRVHITSDDYPIRIFNVGVKQGLDPKLEASYTLKNFDSKAFSRLLDEKLVQPEFVDYVAGNLLNGSYQYAYRLLSKNGSYSLFSIGSNIIPISPTANSGSKFTVNGADTAAKEISGYGIRMKIDMSGIDTTYLERIEIISLYYDSKFGVPTVSIIESINSIPTTELEFTDETNEAKYGTLTYLELTTTSSELSIRSLVSKDDSLFGLYVKEDYFDVEFDARAYQFDSDGDCMITHNGDDYAVDYSGTYPNGSAVINEDPIPANYDAINPNRSLYKFQKNGTTLGAEGEHIQVDFIPEILATDVTTVTSSIGSKVISKGYKQGEVYRFGIVFYNKGISSPVHWIGDFKIPEYTDTILATEAMLPRVTVSFTVNTMGTEALGYSFQIVQQEVTDAYRTILTEGILVPVVQEHNEGHTAPYINPFVAPVLTKNLGELEGSDARITNLTDNTFEPYKYQDRYYNIADTYAVYSPEISITKQFTLSSNLRLAVIGEYILTAVPYKQEDGTTVTNWVTDTVRFKPRNIVSKPISELELLRFKSSTTIDGRLVRSVNDNTSQEDGDDEDEFHWASGTCVVLKTEAGLFGEEYDYTSYPAVRIYRESDPYGGITYNDRLLATYLPASDISSNSGRLVANRGDVVCSKFECFRSFVTENGNYLRQRPNVFTFPIQSVYNADYRYDKSFFNGGGNVKSDVLYPHLLQETGNVTGDLYKYDDAYSAIDRSKLYAALTEDFRTSIVYDTRVIASDKATPDRYVNSWSVFKANNFLNLRGNCGEGTNLLEFNDNVFAFQDSGVSLLSINPRVTQVGNDGIETVLGTGTLLETASYISTEVGTSKHSDVIKSIQSFYFLDQNKRKLYRYTSSGLEALSDTKGIESYLSNTITSDSKLLGIYDNTRKAVYLTVTNNTYEVAEVSEEITEERTITTTTTTTSYEYFETNASTYITGSVIAEDSTVEITVEGIGYLFTCVGTVVDPLTEFKFDADVAVTLSSLKDAIVAKLTSIEKEQYYTVEVIDDKLNIVSLRRGDEYNLEPTIVNHIIDSSGTGTESGGEGYKLVADTTVITENDTWVVVDFSTAGGVDRLDLLKNGSIVAQSGVYQGSNYGFPDAEVSQPKIVDRDGITVRELWKGQWLIGTAYLVGDIVKIVSGTTNNYYVAIADSTGQEPSGSPTYWELHVKGSFNTDVWNVAWDNTNYPPYCYKPAFIGTNSFLVGGGISEELKFEGLVPDRYSEFLAEVNAPSEYWLGKEGDTYDIGLILGGVVSAYNGGSYINARGQRVWAKYNAGDTFKIECMGAGEGTGFRVYYWLIKPQVSDFKAIDIPSETKQSYVVTPVTVTTTEEVTISKTYRTIDVLTTDNRSGLITKVVDDTYLLSGITDLFVLSKNVDYNFNGSYYNVIDIDYENKLVELLLIEGDGVETSEEVDLSRILKFRNPFTLTFNEMLGKFDSFHSFIPLMYTKGYNPFYTIDSNSEIYKHNLGAYGEYYGVKHNSYIDVVLPTKLVNRFTNMSFYLWASDGSERMPDKSLRSVKVYSDGQESDEVILYPKSDVRYIRDDDNGRLPNNGVSVTETIDLVEYTYPYSLLYNTHKVADRLWRSGIPRIKEGSVEFSTARAIGSYCIVRLEFDNSDNIKQVLDTLKFKSNTINSFEE